MILETDAEQDRQIAEWRATHECELRGKYLGAIGGKDSIEFGFTSIGTAIVAKCGCGASLDVTRYEDW